MSMQKKELIDQTIATLVRDGVLAENDPILDKVKDGLMMELRDGHNIDYALRYAKFLVILNKKEKQQESYRDIVEVDVVLFGGTRFRTRNKVFDAMRVIVGLLGPLALPNGEIISTYSLIETLIWDKNKKKYLEGGITRDKIYHAHISIREYDSNTGETKYGFNLVELEETSMAFNDAKLQNFVGHAIYPSEVIIDTMRYQPVILKGWLGDIVSARVWSDDMQVDAPFPSMTLVIVEEDSSDQVYGNLIIEPFVEEDKDFQDVTLSHPDFEQILAEAKMNYDSPYAWVTSSLDLIKPRKFVAVGWIRASKQRSDGSYNIYAELVWGKFFDFKVDVMSSLQDELDVKHEPEPIDDGTQVANETNETNETNGPTEHREEVKPVEFNKEEGLVGVVKGILGFNPMMDDDVLVNLVRVMAEDEGLELPPNEEMLKKVVVDIRKKL